MNTQAEGQVTTRVAVDIESVGVGKLPLVAVRRSEHRHHWGALRNLRLGQLDILGRFPEQHLNRPVVAQPLFHQRGYEFWIRLNSSKLFGLALERHDRVAHEIGGGFVAGH